MRLAGAEARAILGAGSGKTLRTRCHPRYGAPVITAAALAAPSSSAPAWVTYLGLGIAGLSALAVVTNFVWTRAQEHRKERRQYAVHVAAWVGPQVEQCPVVARKQQDDEWVGHHFHTVVVHNGSEQPIYDTTVSVPTPDANELLPGEEPLMVRAVGLVPPGDQVEVEIGDQGQIAPQFAIPLEVYFTDARGTNWFRDEEGKLHRHRSRRDKAAGVRRLRWRRSRSVA